MRRNLGYAILLSACLAGTVGAQEFGNPAGDSPKSPGAAQSSRLTNTTDQLFVQLIGSGGHAEAELGDMAARKARSDEVRRFATRMVDDHGKANKQLARLASSARLDAPDAVADPDHEAQQRHLQGLSGDEFDLEYMRTQIADHQRTATLLQWEVGSGENGALKEYAAQALPIVMAHLESARDIVDRLVAQQR